MSDIVDSLPGQPLPYETASQLADADERFQPVTVLETDGGLLTHTLLYDGTERLTGMGYDSESEEWVIVSRRPDEAVLDGISEEEQIQERKALKDDLRQWARDRYGEEVAFLG